MASSYFALRREESAGIRLFDDLYSFFASSFLKKYWYVFLSHQIPMESCNGIRWHRRIADDPEMTTAPQNASEPLSPSVARRKFVLARMRAIGPGLFDDGENFRGVEKQ